MTAPAATYRLWPSVRPAVIEVVDRAGFARHLVLVSIVAAALSIPAVVRATGVSPATNLAIIAVHIVWTATVILMLRPGVALTPRLFHFTLGGSAVLNTTICVAFPTLGNGPETPLWMIPVMYACFNGAIQELEASFGMLAIHLIVPLLAIPILLVRGGDPGWSIAAPVLCSAVSAIGYNHLAQLGEHWRQSRREREQTLSVLRARLAEEDGARLARDLHDSMGSSLAIVGLFGDLIELHIDQPHELRSITGMVRDASREGGAELNGLMAGMVPVSANLDVVAAALVDTARRAAISSGSTIDVRVLHGGQTEISSAVRLVLVRVFQESLHNALEHGAARHVDVSLAVDAAEATITIVDDGIGFVAAGARAGTGLSGMRSRVAELGGSLTLTTSPAGGAQIRVALPSSSVTP